MGAETIYRFEDPKDFLSFALEAKKRKNPRFSLRSWSRQLGFSSPGMLSMVLTGKRRAQPALVSRVAESLALPDSDRRYLEIMTLHANAAEADDTESRDLYARMLKALRPAGDAQSLDLDRFAIVAEWYHFAIYMMVGLEGFRSSPHWIARRLGGSLSADAVEQAVNRLVRTGLLLRDRDGALSKATGAQVRTLDDVPSDALKTHHKQMIDLAKEALIEDAVSSREFGSNTLTLSLDKMDAAKAAIRRFRDEMAQICAGETADEVYQLNVQFFKLTRGGKP